MVHHLRRAALHVLTLGLAGIPAVAHAHAGHAEGLPWDFEPWVIALLAVSLIAYVHGLRRLWTHAHRGAGVSHANVACFAAGWVVLALSLCSPLDALAADLFAAHMAQHELLMVLAAPLLVLGRPLATWAWALPGNTRAQLPAALHQPLLRRTWSAMTAPSGAFAIHTFAIWVWHVPVLFTAALHHDAVHALQHFSFLFSALLFWWSVVAPARREGQRGAGVTVLSLFATMMHTGALGALLTLSTTAWYGTEASRTAVWGMSPLEDQQIGGLIMWIPAGTVYVVAALWVMGRWIASSGSPTAAVPR